MTMNLPPELCAHQKAMVSLTTLDLVDKEAGLEFFLGVTCLSNKLPPLSFDRSNTQNGISILELNIFISFTDNHTLRFTRQDI